jgi:hypothetical protein
MEPFRGRARKIPHHHKDRSAALFVPAKIIHGNRASKLVSFIRSDVNLLYDFCILKGVS